MPRLKSADASTLRGLFHPNASRVSDGLLADGFSNIKGELISDPNYAQRWPATLSAGVKIDGLNPQA